MMPRFCLAARIKCRMEFSEGTGSCRAANAAEWSQIDPVSLSQITSVSIDGAVLQARVDLRYAHGTE